MKALIAGAILLCGAPLFAQEPTNAPLKIQGKSFNELSPEQRQKLRERHARFLSLPPEEQARIRKSLKIWKELSPEQRNRLRQLHRDMANATPEQKTALQKRMQEFQKLPAEAQSDRVRKTAEGHPRLPDPTPEMQRQVESQYHRIWGDLPPDQRRMLTRLHQRAEHSPGVRERLRKFQELTPEAQKEHLRKMAERRRRAVEQNGQPERPQKPPRRPHEGPPPGQESI